MFNRFTLHGSTSVFRNLIEFLEIFYLNVCITYCLFTVVLYVSSERQVINPISLGLCCSFFQLFSYKICVTCNSDTFSVGPYYSRIGCVYKLWKMPYINQSNVPSRRFVSVSITFITFLRHQHTRRCVLII